MAAIRGDALHQIPIHRENTDFGHTVTFHHELVASGIGIDKNLIFNRFLDSVIIRNHLDGSQGIDTTDTRDVALVLGQFY